MTVKERIIEKLEGLDEARLLELERALDALMMEREEAKSPKRAEEIQRQIEAWHSIAGLLADPDDYAAFEREARRRPLFGGRTLSLEQDEAERDEQAPVSSR